MRRGIIGAVLTAGMAIALGACGIADSRSPLPEFMRREATELPPEPPPDLKRMVREKLDSVFTASSYPHQVRVSQPRRDSNGVGWTGCVRAELTSVNGKPLGTQTYRVSISGGVILDRRHVEADDACASESYEPV